VHSPCQATCRGIRQIASVNTFRTEIALSLLVVISLNSVGERSTRLAGQRSSGRIRAIRKEARSGIAERESAFFNERAESNGFEGSKVERSRLAEAFALWKRTKDRAEPEL